MEVNEPIRRYSLNYNQEHPGVGTQEQWGVELDCAKHGCDPFHTDNGRVFMYPNEVSARECSSINGHAVSVVSRTVYFPEWNGEHTRFNADGIDPRVPPPTRFGGATQ